MALEASFNDLRAEFEGLREAFAEFSAAVADKPARGDSVLVDLFGDAADDLLGWVEEAAQSASEGRQAVSYPLDIECARRKMIVCQERFNLISNKLWSDLVSYERMREIATLGRERRGEWLAWSSGVKSALDSCREPLYNVNQSLFVCWQEITEHMGTSSVSVRTTTIGQQVSVPLPGYEQQQKIT